MATIELHQHNEFAETWLLVWIERKEIIGRVRRGENGKFGIIAHGPHWGPMKSFAATKFHGPLEALKEVQTYFGQR